jgi:hypothetical protein
MPMGAGLGRCRGEGGGRGGGLLSSGLSAPELPAAGRLQQRQLRAPPPPLPAVQEEAYTQQGRAHSRRLHPLDAARPALISRAAHAVESKAVVCIEVAASPRPCLGCAVELVLRVAPLRRGVPPR